MASDISGVEKCGIKHFRGGPVWHHTFQGWIRVASDSSGVEKCMASDISGVDKCCIRHFMGGQVCGIRYFRGRPSVASDISIYKCGIRHYVTYQFYL